MMPGVRAGRFVVRFMNDDPADFTLNPGPVLMPLRNVIMHNFNAVDRLQLHAFGMIDPFFPGRPQPQQKQRDDD